MSQQDDASWNWRDKMKKAKEVMADKAKVAAQQYSVARQTVMEKTGKADPTSESPEVMNLYGSLEENRGQITRLFKGVGVSLDTARTNIQQMKAVAFSLHAIELENEDFSDAMKRIGDKVSQLEAMRESMIEETQASLYMPFKNYIKNDIRDARYAKRNAYDRVRVNFDAELTRRKARNQSLNDADFLQSKEHFEDTELETINMLSDINEKKEVETINNVLKYLEIQRKYFKESLELLDTFAPQIEKTKEKLNQVYQQNKAKKEARDKSYHDRLKQRAPISEETRVFGKSLDAVLSRESKSDSSVPTVVEHIITHLTDSGGLEEEGIFRLSGMKSVIAKIHTNVDRGQLRPDLTKEDPHVVSGLLKSYCRELPEPLMTYKLYPQFLEAGKVKSNESCNNNNNDSNDNSNNNNNNNGGAAPGTIINNSGGSGSSNNVRYSVSINVKENTNDPQKVAAIKAVVDQLPRANYTLLRHLIGLLNRTQKSQATNKMGAMNLAVVFAPNILYSQGGGDVLEEINQCNGIVKILIEDYKAIFATLIDVNEDPQYFKAWTQFVPKKPAANASDDPDHEDD